MKTFSLRKEDVTHRWFLVDATGQPLGRLASQVAQILRGKHKPTFTPHLNGGDCVVIVNAAKVKLTGRKLEQKRYFRHTGYMGHERFTPLKNVLAKHPERVIERAVWGMLPKTTLSRQKVKQMLKVYGGPDHPHAAQQPQPLGAAAGAAGGVTGQAGALRLAIARALCLADEQHRKKLREQGLLTRDPRVVERKKPGRAGARKRFQFSKR